MRILKENTIGLVIDVQEKLFPHMHNYEELVGNLIKLISGLKVLEVPIILTEQYTKGLGPTINSIQEAIGEYTAIEKMAFSCCDEPQFLKVLKEQSKKNVIVCGIESHVCILQTCIDLQQSGYQSVIIEDCISSRKASDKVISLERMKKEGAIISSLESILFELSRVSGTESFKSISRLVK